MSYEETHHFAVVSQNNKHIKKYINLQDVERRPCYVHLKKILKELVHKPFFTQPLTSYPSITIYEKGCVISRFLICPGSEQALYPGNVLSNVLSRELKLKM